MSSDKKPGLFTSAEGKSLAFTFILVSSLFFLWGMCNGMIDTMDKHFQDQLNLTKAESAWVQFAHYMGYAIMALPAGLLTRRLGYKGGIILGLLMVALGGFWFVPATQIAQFWAFLFGVCFIAMGLTVLETVANPYTTVLGPKEYGATRINLAQSCNGVGWIVGPILGSMYFYSEGGVEKAHGQLYIPYVGVGILVVVLSILFMRAPVPDVQVADEYHTDDKTQDQAKARNPVLVAAMMLLNVAAVALSAYLILHTIFPSLSNDDAVSKARELAIESKWWLFAIPVVLSAPFLFSSAKKLSTHSIWAHPHFSGATIAQFIYVAAQAGIFSFFVNSMTVDKNNGFCMVPTLSASVDDSFLGRKNWVEHRIAISANEITDVSQLIKLLGDKQNPAAAFVSENLSAETQAKLAAAGSNAELSNTLKAALVKDLNELLRQELNKKNNKPAFYAPDRFAGLELKDDTKKLAAENPQNDNSRVRLNRMLLRDATSGLVAYDDSKFSISDKGASLLSSIAFGFFLLGRLVGAWLMKNNAPNRILGVFSILNVGVCGLIIANLGWLSVTGVFLSYFFMSIMFPTIFALGIHGLGSQAKKKAAAFIVMSITGGALMPKLMGHLGDVYNMSVSFLVPFVCFIGIAAYGFVWHKLSRAEGTVAVKTGGH